MATWARASRVGEGLLLQFIALHAKTKETHWRTAELLVPHANHWRIIWRSTENLWRNDYWGASTTHTSQKSWGTTEKLHRCYTAPHSPPKEPTEVRLPHATQTTTKEQLRNHWRTAEALAPHTPQRTAEKPVRNHRNTIQLYNHQKQTESLMEIHSSVGFLYHECFAG